MLGVRHIMVASLVPGTCMPYMTYWVNNSTACVSNDMVSNETVRHNALLEDRMQLLNSAIPESSIIILNMTKAFQELFHNGANYGEYSEHFSGSPYLLHIIQDSDKINLVL